MNYYLGVDQGGTKTMAVVCDKTGRILGAGLAEGLVTSYILDTEEVYIKNIRRACEEALAQAGLKFQDITAVCGCLNGADWSFEYPALAKNLYKAVSCSDVVILNDSIGAMRGGSASRQCAVVCAGSGLNIAVRRKDGHQIIYGYYIHDEDQGATALGKAVIGKVMDAYNCLCRPTILTHLLMDYTGYSDVEKLFMDVTIGEYPLRPKNLAGLLLRAYSARDREATKIVEDFSQRISNYVVGAMKRLGLQGEPLEIVYSGSVFKDIGTLITEKITECIHRREPNVIGVDARYEPVCGAVLVLMDRYWGGPLPHDVLQRFDESAVQHGLIRDTQRKGM